MQTVAVPRLYGRRRDWFHVLRCLMKAGVTMHDVGRKCGRDHTTVKGWAEGSEPKESDARVVLALFAKHCAAEYVEHQRQFEVHIEIERMTEKGESFTLPMTSGVV